MNLLVISESTKKPELEEISTRLQANDHQVYLPYDAYDNHTYNVPSFQIDGKTYITTQEIANTVKKEKENYFQHLLQSTGKNKIDAAFFFNPDNNRPISEENYLQLLKLLARNIPIYLYQKSFIITYMASILNKENLIHSMNQNLDQIAPITITDKKLLKRGK